jgi:hypothetical protein
MQTPLCGQPEKSPKMGRGTDLSVGSRKKVIGFAVVQKLGRLDI